MMVRSRCGCHNSHSFEKKNEPPLSLATLLAILYEHDSNKKETAVMVGITTESSVFNVERMRGIGPPYPAWEAGVLPLNYIRIYFYHFN